MDFADDGRGNRRRIGDSARHQVHPIGGLLLIREVSHAFVIQPVLFDRPHHPGDRHQLFGSNQTCLPTAFSLGQKRRANRSSTITTRWVAGVSSNVAAAAAGVPEHAIMVQTGQRSLTTLRKFIREGSLFLENAAAKVGL
jgi:hypothetical protein